MTIRGIAFPFSTSPSGLPAPRSDDDVIADNIERIMLTPRGSRVMRPGTGSSMYDFVFESTGSLLRAQVDFEARRAIRDNEPRAEVLFVKVTESETSLESGRGVQVLVDITYRVNMEIRTASVAF